MTSVDHLDAAPDRIAAFLGHGLTAELIQRIRGVPALRRHLARLLSSRLDDGVATNVVHATAFALDEEGVRCLAYCAGIVWHASPITATIEAGAKRALSEDIGDAHYALALDARRAAIATPSVGMPTEPLRSAAIKEGTSCVAAWCDAQPRSVADRLRLSWPDAEAADIHRRHAGPIIDWLLAGSLVR